MKKFSILFFIGLIAMQMTAVAVPSDYDTEFATNTRNQPGYFKNMAHDWARGLTNIVSFPLEVPVTIMKYHKEDKGAPVVRHLAGLGDGLVRGVARAGSGLWDLGASFIPGDQEGASVKPETLFSKE